MARGQRVHIVQGPALNFTQISVISSVLVKPDSGKLADPAIPLGGGSNGAAPPYVREEYAKKGCCFFSLPLFVAISLQSQLSSSRPKVGSKIFLAALSYPRRGHSSSPKKERPRELHLQFFQSKLLGQPEAFAARGRTKVTFAEGVYRNRG